MKFLLVSKLRQKIRASKAGWLQGLGEELVVVRLQGLGVMRLQGLGEELVVVGATPQE
jgi:hypothetical protein